MILLKANSELKNIFSRMLKTMDANVVWTGNFVVLNNFLILSGNVRSMIFNFDKGKALTNVIELPNKEEDMQPVEGNQVLANVLNMTVYAFGKWGAIQGFQVDKDYSQLNALFYAILKDMKIIPGFRDDNFRFYRDNLQITYEEVIQAAIEEGKRKPQEIKEEKKETAGEEKGLGLWHKIRWSMEKASFKRGEISPHERKASRAGNNFYVNSYQCPSCGRKLFMAVYPEGQEFPIETEEGRVYLARSYTCENCNLFYTPRPGKLLREGDSYAMKFGGDRDAYEDYRELLGSKAERTSNCKFNEFASERGKTPSPSIEEAGANLEQMKDEELHHLEEKIEDGFFPILKAEPYLEKIQELLKKRAEEKEAKKKKKKQEKAEGPKKAEPEENAGKSKGPSGNPKAGAGQKTAGNPKTGQDSEKTLPQLSGNKASGLAGNLKTGEAGDSVSGAGGPAVPGDQTSRAGSGIGRGTLGNQAPEADSGAAIGAAGKPVPGPAGTPAPGAGSGAALGTKEPSGKGLPGDKKKGLFSKKHADAKKIAENAPGKDFEDDIPGLSGTSMSIKEKYDARMRMLDQMSLWQVRRLREQIQSDERLDWVDKEKYEQLTKQAVYKKGEEEARQKADYCMNRPYGVVKRAMEEISQMECPKLVQEELLKTLGEVKKKRGQEEAAALIAKVPENMTRSQYHTFREKLNQYDGEDISVYNEVLEGSRRLSEKREIAGMLKRAARSDRNGLMRMMNQLKEDGFLLEQAEPAIREIEGRIRAIDEKVIDKICPNIMGMTFNQAAEAYEKIEGGVFLPALKTDTLEMIDKRLTKLKMDECGLLVEKLKDSLEGKINDTERIHFYEVRNIMRGDFSPREAELVARALNTYATERDRYEFPILVCDSSSRKNGGEGFILTPDHIFYNTLFNSEAIPIRSITGMEGNSGLLNKGIYVKRGNGKKTKIPGGIPAKELKAFAEVLEEFISYLQEKPESRSIAYLSKENHEVKCCYRCGFTYRGGNVCPKCGNQANH